MDDSWPRNPVTGEFVTREEADRDEEREEIQSLAKAAGLAIAALAVRFQVPDDDVDFGRAADALRELLKRLS